LLVLTLLHLERISREAQAQQYHLLLSLLRSDAYAQRHGSEVPAKYEWKAISNVAITRGNYEQSISGACYAAKVAALHVTVRDG
jgi:hypothetical protein